MRNDSRLRQQLLCLLTSTQNTNVKQRAKGAKMLSQTERKYKVRRSRRILRKQICIKTMKLRGLLGLFGDGLQSTKYYWFRNTDLLSGSSSVELTPALFRPAEPNDGTLKCVITGVNPVHTKIIHVSRPHAISCFGS